ncbi:hypothetical protein GCM10009681_49380 [Luedemannella helvata]|uniref:Methyltransferase type 11 domain-containing protein n=1 Tax=Luedemannella helvata TaxID=349315 RepID=A0ABN2L1W3_9ACTN
MLDQLRELLRSAGKAGVVVDGADAPRRALFTDQLVGAGFVVTDGPQCRVGAPPRDLVVWLRAGGSPHGHEAGADVVIDLRDPAWPVIRRVRDGLAAEDSWYVTESRAFFAIRAVTWDTQFGDDLPAYARGVSAANLPRGGVVLDAGCGTGRALGALRDAVGEEGVVLALDVTPEMLAVAAGRAREARASLLLSDARRLPIADASVDGVFAAGLVNHMPDPVAGLAELARVTRPGGRLALFHPSGRAALAARHRRVLREDDLFAQAPLRAATGRAGWRLDTYDDHDERFLALATRVPAGSP